MGGDGTVAFIGRYWDYGHFYMVFLRLCILITMGRRIIIVIPLTMFISQRSFGPVRAW
jgi:hypothetical protein